MLLYEEPRNLSWLRTQTELLYLTPSQLLLYIVKVSLTQGMWRNAGILGTRNGRRRFLWEESWWLE